MSDQAINPPINNNPIIQSSSNPITPIPTSHSPASPAGGPLPTPNPPPNPTPVYDTGFTANVADSHSASAYLKLVYILILVAGFSAGSFFLAKNVFSKANSSSNVPGEILLEIRYKPVMWKDFGEVFEPIVTIPLIFPDNHTENNEFLLDSGALVSSLPREKAKELGFSLSQLPRSTFAGFGGTTSFAYKANVKIKLGKIDVSIPAVFTEATGTKYILGRSGFFETYSIYFNSKDEKIEIRK